MRRAKPGLRALVTSLLLAPLLGCGGGGDSGQAAATDETTLTALNTSNLTPSVWGASADQATKRWALPVPVKTNGDTEAIAAMDAIERTLGITVFDHTSIASVADSNITRGLIVVRGGGGCIGSGSVCGSVTSRSTSITSTGTVSAVLSVNLGGFNADQQRVLPSSEDVAIHEFGHALGLMVHFDGFGIGPATGPLFWRTLRTLYANPAGTPKAQVVLAP